MLPIVQAPNPVLAQKGKAIAKIDSSLHDLIAQMTETLEKASDPEGVGLAAPQVGKSLQLFIIKQTPKSPILTFINPHLEAVYDSSEKTTAQKKKSDTKLEGCLSLNNIWGVVRRHESVLLSYMDEQGTYHKRKFSGFLATIIQHEYDHINGILFPKRVLEQGQKLYKSSKDENGETVFEEIEI